MDDQEFLDEVRRTLEKTFREIEELFEREKNEFDTVQENRIMQLDREIQHLKATKNRRRWRIKQLAKKPL